MNWVKMLVISDSETIEQRLAQVLSFLQSRGAVRNIMLDELDATGTRGDLISTLVTHNPFLIVTFVILLELATEEGQIIELSCMFEFDDAKFEILLRDGHDFDVLGDVAIDDQALGAFTYGDIGNYYER